MKRYLLLFIIFLSVQYGSYCDTPVVRVPPLPTAAQLETYEDNEGIFSLKTMEYYQMAVQLETQLILMGETVKSITPAPTLEELGDMDYKTMKKYHDIADNLQKRIENSTMTYWKRVSDLQDTVIKEKKEKWEVRAQSANEKITLANDLDSMYSEKISIMEKNIFNHCKDYVNVFSVAFNINQFITNGGSKQLENDAYLGVSIIINTYKIIGFWRGLDLWFNYYSPKLTTVTHISGDTILLREDWKSNLASLGLSGRLRINDSPDYIDGVRVGFGYFWSQGNIYNNNTGSYFTFSGTNLNIEYYGGIPSSEFPFELYAGLQIYHSFSQSLKFITNNGIQDKIDVGATHISFGVGFRYNIYRNPF